MDAAQAPLHSLRYRWLLAALTLAAWGLRLPPAVANRFHADEALYARWGLLIACGRDPLLLHAQADKPPLLFYLMAGAQSLIGRSELAARLPGLVAGLLLIPLTAAWARALYAQPWVALAAAVGVAFSPFGVLFSATAFTDPLMTTLGVAACAAAARNRPGWAGALAGLACAAKQNGAVWLPLVAGVGLYAAQTGGGRAAARFVAGFAPPIAAMFAWDAARTAQGAASFWQAGVVSYGGLRLSWPQELWGRLRAWLGLARYIFAAPLIEGALLAGAPFLVWKAVARGRRGGAAVADLLLTSYTFIFLMVHWLWEFQLWDRYLLPLLPILSILLGRVVSGTRTNTDGADRQSVFFRVFPRPAMGLLLCLILMLAPGARAAQSGYPVGGDHGAYDGIDEAAAFLRAAPAGSVVYHHWLGWHYGFYLFDAPLALAYWPTPAWLAQDVQVFGEQKAHYITFPAWESSARVEYALREVGYGLTPALTTHRRDGEASFRVYRIVRMGE